MGLIFDLAKASLVLHADHSYLHLQSFDAGWVEQKEGRDRVITAQLLVDGRGFVQPTKLATICEVLRRQRSASVCGRAGEGMSAIMQLAALHTSSSQNDAAFLISIVDE
ncbi:hypothetical protein [Pseudoduganella sp.]|uniref:hypothetical protein n=1 Tax=Pseudoduganella sp. TaxID=1880898 RepID=UPI0035B4D6EC